MPGIPWLMPGPMKLSAKENVLQTVGRRRAPFWRIICRPPPTAAPAPPSLSQNVTLLRIVIIRCLNYSPPGILIRKLCYKSIGGLINGIAKLYKNTCRHRQRHFQDGLHINEEFVWSVRLDAGKGLWTFSEGIRRDNITLGKWKPP